MDAQVYNYPKYHSKELVLRIIDAQRYNRPTVHNSIIPGNIYISDRVFPNKCSAKHKIFAKGEAMEVL
jgi:hypothetical protein